MEQEVIQQTAEGFIGKYGWLLLAGAATIIFKDIVSQFAAGLTIWFSKEYTPDDIVLINGRKARIVRVGIKSTTFYFPDTSTKKTVSNATFTGLDIERKIRLATILGTAQSTLTDFPYLRKTWRTNTEEERLLGVSLTGIMDNIHTNCNLVDMDKRLIKYKQVAINTNKEFAKQFGIQESTAITCVKPSGTVSQLCDSASGIHARHSRYYIRTVRGDNKDPLTNFMVDQGVPNEPCVMKPDTTTVFSFPMQSPKGSKLRNDLSAIDQLNIWLVYQEHWCEHKPSITVTVKEDEWLDVGAFVFKHFDKMSGVSFLPHSDHVYQQAPYQECTKDEYNDMLSRMNTRINWNKLRDYEKGDTTSGSQTMACSGDSCEVVDIGV